MIKKLTLKNFRNFENSEFFFSEQKNIIIWENWRWKTNILEAISLFSWDFFNKINFKNLVNKNNDVFFIEILNQDNDKLAISYDKKENKKNYFINSKKTTKKKLEENSFKIVKFSPISMNIMYLSPSLRRDFLDNILANTFLEYKEIFSQYKKILNSRNKILKNIKLGNSKKEDLNFWNTNFVNKAILIYNYRLGIFDYFKEFENNFLKIFNNKVKKIEFNYKTKLNLENLRNKEKQEKIELLKKELEKKLEEKLELDILQGSTNVWPHLDDFEILVDNINLTEFASRWEVKSILLYLKELEIKFLEKYTSKKPILLIDDLLSELDQEHKNLIIEKIQNYQSFITSIRDDYLWENNLIKLN